MMRIGFECDKPLSMQVVDDPLHVLTIRAQVAGDPRYRLGTLRRDDRAENLPAGAR